MAHQLWHKATKLYHKQNQSAQELAIRLSPNGDPTSHPLVGCDLEEGDGGTMGQALVATGNKWLVDTLLHSGTAPQQESPLVVEAQNILEAEAQKAPVAVLAVLAALCVWLVASDAVKEVVRCGGFTYWLLVVSIVPVVMVLMAAARRFLIHKAVVKQQVGLTAEAGDITWTPHTTLWYPLLCSFAGVIAGMFGVGGGIVKGPLMLHLGVLPEVAAATSATMILFTSCSASVVHLTFGGAKADYAGLMVVSGFAVTLVGQVATYHIIERHGRRSIVVVAMAVLLTACAAIMCYEIFRTIAHAQHDGFLHGAERPRRPEGSKYTLGGFCDCLACHHA